MDKIGARQPQNTPHVTSTTAPPAPLVYRGADKDNTGHSLIDSFWSSVNHLATKPVQFYFSHGSNNVKLSPADQNLGRFGPADAREILAHAQPGDVILWGTKESFVHGSIYIGNGEIVHALAARAPQGVRNGVIREKLVDYMARVERHRVQILRPKKSTPADVAARIDFALKQVGKDYDYLFRTGKYDAFYCTELAWSTALQGPHAPPIDGHNALFGLKRLITTDDIRRSPDLKEIWGKNVPPLGDKPALGLS